MPSRGSLVVFSDLDDTLLDAHRSPVDASVGAAFDALTRQRIPVVLCSSRTRAELERAQQQLGFCHPFICESGAAVFIPRGYFPFDVPSARDVAGYEAVELGQRYADVVETLHRIANRTGVSVIGFSEMSVEDVARDCELPLLQAQLAKLREYGEPFRLVDAERGAVTRLFKALRAAGIDCRERGRYYYAGASVQYEPGVALLTRLYRRAYGSLLTAALGDNVNAVALLQNVDIPVIVQHPSGDAIDRMLDDVPAARVARAETSGDWVGIILEMAEAAERRRVC